VGEIPKNNQKNKYIVNTSFFSARHRVPGKSLAAPAPKWNETFSEESGENGGGDEEEEEEHHKEEPGAEELRLSGEVWTEKKWEKHQFYCFIVALAHLVQFEPSGLRARLWCPNPGRAEFDIPGRFGAQISG
jgi:hypothetical protein